jgi:hypothetical protein
MNARTSLITASLTLALIVPTVAGAAGSGNSNSGHRQQPQSSGAAIKLSTYDAQAYVPGGASQKVAKAITSAGKQRPTTNAYNAQAYVPGGASQKVAKAIVSAGKSS